MLKHTELLCVYQLSVPPTPQCYTLRSYKGFLRKFYTTYVLTRHYMLLSTESIFDKENQLPFHQRNHLYPVSILLDDSPK